VTTKQSRPFRLYFDNATRTNLGSITMHGAASVGDPLELLEQEWGI